MDVVFGSSNCFPGSRQFGGNDYILVCSGLVAQMIEQEWEEYNDYYCTHGFYKGHECPDCDTSSPIAVFDADPGDCNDYKERNK